MEHQTSARLADELASLGYRVHRNVGGTGIVALLENGEGPLVMFRADMDGLPVEEKSGLAYASRAKQVDPNGNEVFVMHACGHDVHITSLVGTAQIMAERRDEWQGTLMLIGQPAEERVMGAAAMRADNIWDRFGQPDYAMAFHVTSAMPTGMLGAWWILRIRAQTPLIFTLPGWCPWRFASPRYRPYCAGLPDRDGTPDRSE